MPSIRSRIGQSGFTLVEMAIVIAIAGLILVGLVPLLNSRQSGSQLSATRNTQEAIMTALATYAQRNGRIPCPASPTLADTAANFGSEVSPCVATSAAAEGIVPFRDLGLQASNAKDAYGRYITYRISPIFTAINTTAGGLAPTADAQCRLSTSPLWVNASNVNLNPAKARFCCPVIANGPQNTDVEVRDNTGVTVVSPIRAANAAANPDVGTATATVAPLSAVAVILISHGKNGQGAFLANGAAAPNNRLGRVGGAYTNVGAGGPGPNEANFNGDETSLTKVDAITNEVAATYFDDIVMWKTQDQLYAFLGRQTCTAP